jgi:trans-2,3-dihydro-3-hydroxyanthranilate isomerase
MRRRFATLDVFTSKRFAGNPLAVVLEPEGLDTAAMQAIAREFNLSETVFVFPPAEKQHRAALRIFTPGRELPFAGHPTVGTAVLLGRLDGGSGARKFVLEEKVGPVPCSVEPSQEGGHATFDIPRLPAQAGDVADAATLARALSLAPGDIGFAGFTASRWSAGNPFTVVPVRGLDAMARCRPDLAHFDAAFGGGDFCAPFVVCGETAEAGNTFHARMFAPGVGVAEDPATGSAAAAFAGYLAAHGGYRDGAHMVRIEQGYEMGRPSLMELTLKIAGGKLTGASIGGGSVVVTEGTIEA